AFSMTKTTSTSKYSLLSSLREALIVSLSFALASCFVLFAALAADAQTAAPSSSPATPGWVVIPVEEYKHLRAQAFPAERDPDPPPVEATLTRVDYDLHVNGSGDLATGQASLTVDVVKDGWVRVPIPTCWRVREARLDGKLVSLDPGMQGKGGNQLSVVLSHPGRAVLLLDVALPVSAAAGEERIALPSTSSGVTRAAIQLPRQGVDVKLAGGLLAGKTGAGAEGQRAGYRRWDER